MSRPVWPPSSYRIAIYPVSALYIATILFASLLVFMDIIR